MPVASYGGSVPASREGMRSDVAYVRLGVLAARASAATIARPRHSVLPRVLFGEGPAHDFRSEAAKLGRVLGVEQLTYDRLFDTRSQSDHPVGLAFELEAATEVLLL